MAAAPRPAAAPQPGRSRRGTGIASRSPYLFVDVCAGNIVTVRDVILKHLPNIPLPASLLPSLGPLLLFFIFGGVCLSSQRRDGALRSGKG